MGVTVYTDRRKRRESAIVAEPSFQSESVFQSDMNFQRELDFQSDVSFQRETALSAMGGAYVCSEKTQPNVLVQIHQLILNNNQIAIIVADWDSAKSEKLIIIRDAIFKALGTVDQTLDVLTAEQIKLTPILTFGDAAKNYVLQIGTPASLSITYSFLALLDNPVYKREAWQVMQAFLQAFPELP